MNVNSKQQLKICQILTSLFALKQGIDLMKKHHVYMLPSSGRINLGAVTHKNVEKVANALADVVLNGQKDSFTQVIQ